jgi:hypothetical protein
MRDAIIIPDLHAPYHHPDAIDFLADIRRRHKRADIYCIGDLGDQHAWSRYGRHPDALGQAEEYTTTTRAIASLTRLFPRVRACIGNHDRRVMAAIIRSTLPSIVAPSVRDIYGTPRGWIWRDRWRAGRVWLIHGEGYGSSDGAALRAARHLGSPCIMGHIHSVAGAQHATTHAGSIWGLSVGCLVDPDSVAMAYGRECRHRPVLGAGLIVDGVPLFFPMGMGASGKKST